MKHLLLGAAIGLVLVVLVIMYSRSLRDRQTYNSQDEVFTGRTWDERILSLVDLGIDGTLIEDNLRRTPTERLQRMQEMARFIEEARRSRNRSLGC